METFTLHVRTEEIRLQLYLHEDGGRFRKVKILVVVHSGRPQTVAVGGIPADRLEARLDNA